MTLPAEMPHVLNRTVLIRATPEVVFRFFTDTPRWASWWGAGSTIDARPGGRMYIRHPNGIEATGDVIAVDPPRRFVFSYGYASNAAIPPGSSRVTITLQPNAAGTMLTLAHELADATVRDEHVQGWRFQLSLFANAVSDEVNRNATAVADAWFGVWNDPDAAAREKTMRRIASPDITMSDRYSCLSSLPDLLAHIEASRRFMPGVHLSRSGTLGHCQGVALADFVAVQGDRELMRGTNVFTFGPDGKLEAVVGVTRVT
jgi:uncharacterized protein YndB with AHSA1/START domain